MADAVKIDAMAGRRVLPERRACETFDLCHGGQRVTFCVTLGRYNDGPVGEVFICGAKAGSEVEAVARDGAILLSLALQHGVPLDVIAGALTRESSGAPSTIIGAVVQAITAA